MIKLAITYKNFDNAEVTEDHYFHLSKNELVDWVSENDGEDIVTKLERVGNSGDPALIMRTLREIIARAYGQRVDGDAGQFYKDEDLTKRFLGSLAFDQLFEDLLTNEVSAAAFINGIMPANLEKLAAAAEKARTVEDVPMPGGNGPNLVLLRQQTGLKNPLGDEDNPLPWAMREPTEKELTSMTQSQLLDVMRRKNAGWTPHSSGVPATA